MKMSLWVDNLRSDVVALGELGDDTVAEAAERIAAALGRSAPGRLLDLLSEAVGELSAELPGGRVEIRVAGDDVGLAYVDGEAEPTGDGADGDRDLSARITLRLGESLKARLEESAGQQGVSVNTLVLRTLDRATSSRRERSGPGRGGNRLRGYGLA